MQIVGEASDWSTALAEAPATNPDMLMVDWGLVAAGIRRRPGTATHGLPGSSCDRTYQSSRGV